MQGERVLIVDDDPAMLRSVERILASRYRVTTATTAREALLVAPNVAPDLAIVDIRMPQMDGFELVARLRECCPGVDVLFMTGVIHELDEQLVRSIRERAFYFIQKPFDREVLLTLVQRCVELRRLAADNRRYVRRLEAELEAARRFQRQLLPPSAATIEGVAIAARFQPCDQLGGDFYDFAAAGAGRATVLIADVTGHGVSAAMLTAIVKSAFHEACVDDHAPRAVVERIASGLRTFGPDRFVTAFCATIDGVRGEIEYVNAGHPAGLLLVPGTSGTPLTPLTPPTPPTPRTPPTSPTPPAAGAPGPSGRSTGSTAAGELRALPSNGPLITPALPDAIWEAKRVAMPAGTSLVLYTDGVTEAPGEGGEFGDQRLRDTLTASRATGGELLDAVLDAVRAFSGGRPEEDDLTLLTATVT